MGRIINNTGKVLREVDRLIQEKLEQAGQLVEDNIVIFVPVATGATRDSRAHEVKSKKVTIGVATDYAPIIEVGSSLWKGQPFLRPALVQSFPGIKKIFASK